MTRSLFRCASFSPALLLAASAAYAQPRTPEPSEPQDAERSPKAAVRLVSHVFRFCSPPTWPRSSSGG